VVDELVGAELENKQAPNEGGDVEANIIVVDHVEKSVIAWWSFTEGRRRGEVSWVRESLKVVVQIRRRHRP